jgi:uncharacterized protein YndB with AHSA1/START domain
MDTVTGAHVAIARTVPVPRERMWDMITDIARVGEWSPETVAGTWFDGAEGPYRGARFIGRNHYPDGVVRTVTCAVTEAARPATFAWTVLDEDGQVGSIWRYDLSDGREPASTVVYHSFTHGPGRTGARDGERLSPGSLNRRLSTLSHNMAATIEAMVASATLIGATR